MPKPDRVIDLEPRSPFSWRILAVFFVAWIAVFVAMLVFKLAMLRVLLPLIAVLLVIYLTACTILFIKRRR